MELSMWLASTCFFSFILAHLLADVLFSYRTPLYHFSYFLIPIGIGGIIYLELNANKHHITSKKIVFESQGRILGFELVIIMIALFVANH